MSPCSAARTGDQRPKRVKRVIRDKAVSEAGGSRPEGKARGAREARDFLLRAFSYARPLRTIQGFLTARVKVVCNSGSRASRASSAAAPTNGNQRTQVRTNPTQWEII
jgi:hypothetical protein